MMQDADGYLHDHVAATFHAAHYYRLIGEEVPKGEAMLARVLRDQKADGSWMLNAPGPRPARHVRRRVRGPQQVGGDRPEARKALAKAAAWSLSCRNPDGGFGHFPGSTSDADACFFHAGVLVMAGATRAGRPAPGRPPPARLGPPVSGQEVAPRRHPSPASEAPLRFGEGCPDRRSGQFLYRPRVVEQVDGPAGVVG